MEDNMFEGRELFISYLDINNQPIEGYFEFVGDNGWAIRFKTKNNNTLTIPHARILRIKEKGN